jgi:hypothetical protein
VAVISRNKSKEAVKDGRQAADGAAPSGVRAEAEMAELTAGEASGSKAPGDAESPATVSWYLPLRIVFFTAPFVCVLQEQDGYESEYEEQLVQDDGDHGGDNADVSFVEEMLREGVS